MRKAMTVFMVVMMVAVGIVMYMYWQREESVMMKGVLVENRSVVEEMV